ncbi:MAG: ABC transporter permease [Methanomethylophilus sp.]|nr:ABC transporter permease [Methanomethylophilus sp.]
MHVDFKDDMRQAYVIAKNEIKKFFRGKKILLFGALVLAVVLLQTIIPIVFNSPYDSKGDVLSSFVSFSVLLVELAGVLFTATSIVSEFEDRTALVLFTKPIRKWSIFVGKLMASMIAVGAFILIYYLYAAILSLTAPGAFDSVAFGQSLVLAFCAVFGVCGVSMLFSAFSKKGSTASILTLVFFILLIGLISGLLNSFAHIETWWSIDDASGYISYVFKGTRPIVLDAAPYVDYIALTGADVIRAGAVMIIWGILTNIGAFYLFNKRDF